MVFGVRLITKTDTKFGRLWASELQSRHRERQTAERNLPTAKYSQFIAVSVADGGDQRPQWSLNFLELCSLDKGGPWRICFYWTAIESLFLKLFSREWILSILGSSEVIDYVISRFALHHFSGRLDLYLGPRPIFTQIGLIGFCGCWSHVPIEPALLVLWIPLPASLTNSFQYICIYLGPRWPWRNQARDRLIPKVVFSVAANCGIVTKSVLLYPFPRQCASSGTSINRSIRRTTFSASGPLELRIHTNIVLKYLQLDPQPIYTT